MRKLEIGPKYARLGPEWTTLDVAPGELVDHVATWGEDRLPFDDATFGLVYACHVIEHLPWWQTVDALRDVLRILIPGGCIEVHTVDFGVLLRAHSTGSALDGWTCGGRNPDLDPMRWIASRLFAYGQDRADPQWHKAMFDEPYLRRCLETAGFVGITDAGRPRGPDDHGVVNLGVEGWKP